MSDVGTVFVWNFRAFKPPSHVPPEELVFRVKSLLAHRGSKLLGLYILCSRNDPERLDYSNSDVGLVHILEYDDHWNLAAALTKVRLSHGPFKLFLLHNVDSIRQYLLSLSLPAITWVVPGEYPAWWNRLFHVLLWSEFEDIFLGQSFTPTTQTANRLLPLSDSAKDPGTEVISQQGKDENTSESGVSEKKSLEDGEVRDESKVVFSAQVKDFPSNGYDGINQGSASSNSVVASAAATAGTEDINFKGSSSSGRKRNLYDDFEGELTESDDEQVSNIKVIVPKGQAPPPEKKRSRSSSISPINGGGKERDHIPQSGGGVFDRLHNHNDNINNNNNNNYVDRSNRSPHQHFIDPTMEMLKANMSGIRGIRHIATLRVPYTIAFDRNVIPIQVLGLMKVVFEKNRFRRLEIDAISKAFEFGIFETYDIPSTVHLAMRLQDEGFVTVNPKTLHVECLPKLKAVPSLPKPCDIPMEYVKMIVETMISKFQKSDVIELSFVAGPSGKYRDYLAALGYKSVSEFFQHMTEMKLIMMMKKNSKSYCRATKRFFAIAENLGLDQCPNYPFPSTLLN